MAIGLAAWYWQSGDVPFVAPAGAFDELGNPVVLMFTIDRCGKACELARKQLHQRNVIFHEILIDPQQQDDPNVRLWKRLGEDGFPYIVAGDERMVGSGTASMMANFLGRSFGEKYLTRAERKFYRQHFYSDGTPKIVMYASDDCRFCTDLREEFVSNGVAFLEIDVEKSSYRERIRETMDISGYPVTWVGYTRVDGTSLAAIDRVYRNY